VKIILGVNTGEGADRPSVQQYPDDGTSDNDWTFSHGTSVNCVGSFPDPSRGVALGGGQVGSGSSRRHIRRVDADGAEVWSRDFGIPTTGSQVIQKLAIDSAGNVWFGGVRDSSNNNVKKYNGGNGNLIYSRDFGANVWAMAIDADDSVYVGGIVNSSINVRKWNSTGTLQWSRLYGGGTPRALAVDADGNVYVGGGRSSSKTTYKFDADGTLVWDADHGASSVLGIAVDAAGNVYTTGTRTSSITTRKYLADGTEVTTGNWPYDYGANTTALAWSEQWQRLYIGGAITGGKFLRCLNPDGSVIYSRDFLHSALNDIALYDPPVARPPALALPIRLGLPVATLAAGDTTLAPALALPFALRVPLLITDREDLAPGLALNLALRLPTIRLEHPRAFQFADVYALYLGGVLLPFSSISCRRDAGGLGLTATIPSASAELLAAVAANEGGILRVLRGPRLPDGSVQLDGLWSATLDTWSYRAGAEAGSITLQASAPTAIQAARPRALREISFVGSGQGKRRIRCRIDTYLSPGDLALLGAGQTLSVNDLTYSIQPGQAFMEVGGF
jgi:hypothetical protein